MLGHLTARVIDSWSNDLRDRGGVSVQTRKKFSPPCVSRSSIAFETIGLRQTLRET